MDHTTVGKGAHLRRAIIDRFNIIPADVEIGHDPAADRRSYHVDASGLVVVPRGGRREFLRGIEEF
jgi:glucose-1-phosphate adenylyltransferase